MNLQENKLPLIVRRRLHELDEILGDLLKNTVYATHEICTYSNSHQLIEYITYSVINEHMYYMYFEHIDDTSKEWESLYRGMEEYLVKKYGDKLEKYYERMCENRNTNLDESIRRILIQETEGIDPFIRRRIDLRKFEDMFDQGKIYMFYESDTSEEFKWKLVTATLENYLYYKDGIDIDMSDGKYDTVINNLIDHFDDKLESIYKSLKKDRGMDLKEEISSKEAYSEFDSIKTVVDGKRNIAFTTLDSPKSKIYVFLNGLKKIKVPSDDAVNYIIYRDGSEEMANELLQIANKYGGKLHYDASEEDSRRIGQILNYHPNEIEDYIRHNKNIKGDVNESKFFRRRIPLGKIENLLRPNAQQTYYETESYDQFKYELTLKAVETVMYIEYDMGWEDLPEQEEIEFVTKVSDVLEDKIKSLYNYYNKK